MKYTLFGEESARLIFHEVTERDFPTWLEFFKDPRATEFWPMPSTPEVECRLAFDNIYQRYANGLGGMNALINKTSGDLIGMCGLLIQTVDGMEELEIGYSILPIHWKKGYATEAAMKCKAFAFENKFRDSLISIIQEKNVPSQKVAASIGMTLEKKTVYKNMSVHIYRVFHAQ